MQSPLVRLDSVAWRARGTESGWPGGEAFGRAGELLSPPGQCECYESNTAAASSVYGQRRSMCRAGTRKALLHPWFELSVIRSLWFQPARRSASVLVGAELG
jgi:hypothetical protein